MQLSLIIPAYNEENDLKEFLSERYDFLKNKLNDSFEIIIVPNNCSDNTYSFAQNFAKGKKNVVVFNIPNYSGKGGAVMKGFELAKGDYVGYLDGDNSTDIKEFFKLYEYKEDFDCIIASRRIKGAKVKRKFRRNISSILFNRLTNFLFKFNLRDTQCGAKLFTRRTKTILLKFYSETGWIFDVDILNICKKNKLSIKEIPIIWNDSEYSRLCLKEQFLSVIQLIKYWIKNK